MFYLVSSISEFEAPVSVSYYLLLFGPFLLLSEKSLGDLGFNGAFMVLLILYSLLHGKSISSNFSLISYPGSIIAAPSSSLNAVFLTISRYESNPPFDGSFLRNSSLASSFNDNGLA
jgi:hypothetical protein